MALDSARPTALPEYPKLFTTNFVGRCGGFLDQTTMNIA